MTIDDLYRILRADHIQAQGIVDTVEYPLVVLDAQLRVQAASRSFFETFRVDSFDTVGKPFYELGNGQWDIPELRRLLGEVIPRSSAVIDYRVDHDFPGLGPRTMLVTARVLQTPGNASSSLLLSLIDATRRIQRDMARDILSGELKHRITNLMAVTQAIARRTRVEGRSAAEYREDLLGRLQSLSEAHVLTFGEADEARLSTLVDRILAPYRDRHAIVIEHDGDPALASDRLLTLGLVLHELATNAAKYGALSVPGGRVHLGWKVDRDTRVLRLDWSEAGGPPVGKPSAPGYGTELIQSAVAYSLGGRAEQRFTAGGLETELTFPLAPLPEPTP